MGGRAFFHVCVVALCGCLEPAAEQQDEGVHVQGLSLLQIKRKDHMIQESACTERDRACLEDGKCCSGSCDGLLCAPSDGAPGITVVDVTNDPERRVKAYLLADESINQAAYGGFMDPKTENDARDYFDGWPGTALAVYQGDTMITGCGFLPIGGGSQGLQLDWLGSSAQGKGGGAAAIREMNKWALRKGYTWVGLFPTNEAADFYSKRGFEEAPRVKDVSFKKWLADLRVKFGADLAEDVGKAIKDLKVRWLRILTPPTPKPDYADVSTDDY